MSSSRRKQRRKASRAAHEVARAPTSASPPRRVYLKLVSDDASGEPRLELRAPVFSEDWQNRMTLATANTAFGLLRQERSAATAAHLGKKTMEAASTLTSSLLSRAPAGAVACRSGCAHCCHQRVGATVPEVLAIFSALVAARTAAELRELGERVEGAHRATRGLTRDERNSPQHPCPLLEDGLCSVYEVRPLACRGVHSLDEQACKDKLNDRQRRAAYERGELPGHSFVEPVRAVHAISAGLQLGLYEVFGLDLRPLELTAALALLFADLRRNAPGERARRWLEGAPAFAEALGGDATDHQGQVELTGAVAVAPRRGEGA